VRNLLFYILLLSELSGLGVENNSFEIVSQNDSSITIHFTLPQFQLSNIVIDSINYSSIIAKECQYIGAKSFPELPKYSTSILIPENAKIHIDIIDSNYTNYSNLRILPSAGSLKRQTILSDFIEGEQYSKNEYYPTSSVSCGNPFKIRNWNGVSVFVYPFSYNPITKKVIVKTDITITISFGENYITSYSTPESSEFNNTIVQHFLNYKKSKLKSTITTYNPSSMLVVSPSKYVQSLQPFISWKNQKGIETKIIVTDSLTTVAQFQNLIKNYYYKYKNTYVLLVGDSNDIPQIKKIATTDNSRITSDNAYGYIIGDDSYPEIIIGRLTANSVSDISTQIQRIIHYEKRLTNDSSTSKYLMIASAEGPSLNGEYDYQHLQKIADSLKTFDFNGGDELYDGSRGGADAIGNPTPKMVCNSINAGKGLFFYTGHSSGNMLTSSSFATNNVKDFTNIGNFPFGIIAGCRAGQLSQDTCIAEACLWANRNNVPTGMVTMMASTVDQWWNPPMGGQDMFSKSLIHGDNTDTIPSFGLLALKSFLYINDKYQQEGFETTDSWSIFGDPSLQIFTKKADSTTLSFNKNITIGQDTLTIYATQEKAWISLSINNKILGIYRINEGKVFAQFPTLVDTGVFVITAYGFNLVPVIDSVQIKIPQNDFLVISDFKALSNDSIISNGDTVSISVTIKNIGLKSTSLGTISASSDDTTISIIQSTAKVKNIGAGSQIILDKQFTLKVSENAPNQSLASIQFNFTIDSIKSYSIVKQITINAPTLCYLGKTFKPTIASNENKIIEAGEIVDFGIIINNEGKRSATISNITFSTPSSEIFSYLKSGFPTTMIPGETDTIYFRTAFANTINYGKTIPFDITCQFNKRNLNVRDSVKVGEIKETWENNVLTNYKWENATVIPWFITDTTAHLGAHSLQSGKISNNQSTTISLSITVPTNDSISFWAMTSCESPQYSIDHYIYYDYLDFRIDGISKYRQAGVTNWENSTIPVTSGFHTFSWTYQKDSSDAEGTDNAWIDDIILPYFNGNIQPHFAITSSPITETIVDSEYHYSVTTNQAPLTTIKTFKSPTWISLTENTLHGVSPKVEIDTIVISAFASNMFANQVLILTTNDFIKSDLIYSESIIYPNPATSFLKISDSYILKNYSIFDNLGKMIKTGIIDNNKIDIADLPNNIYFLTLWNNRQKRFIKFIKIQ